MLRPQDFQKRLALFFGDRATSDIKLLRLSLRISFNFVRKHCTFVRSFGCSVFTAVSGDFGPRLFRTGDFGRQSEISDGDFGRCAVNSDAQLSSLLYHYFGTNIAIFGW